MSEDFLIGTYTQKNSQGIYAVTLNSTQGCLENVRLVAKSEKPAYLQVDSCKHLFAIKQNGKQGGVAAYQLKDGQASLINEVLGAGAPPAYVGIDEQRHLLFSANYHTAKINVFRINEDGSLTLTDSVTHQGMTGPRPEQQDGPHCHYADLTPDGRLIVCDLGMDLLVVYDISDDGKLTAASRYHCESGFGARHLAFHPNSQVLYVLGELSSKLTVLAYHAQDASFKPLQTIATIPSSWTSHNGAAAIHITKDGRFVYVSNRGEDTIAVFAVQNDFSLKHIQSISTEGSFPRDFELSSDEKFLLAGNQNSDSLALYQRNDQTGLLKKLQQNVTCPEPVCIKRWP
ncbi:lactonase family protein [Limosilactobacillus difficilis]|uniref:lactonase family protein n=1 Tax=Limosilactobacillus difficilis TaxID=2991838 RepID=UPI0024B8AF16|nr:lactonase family protein [Limosilactobacillus difficilis]